MYKIQIIHSPINFTSLEISVASTLAGWNLTFQEDWYGKGNFNMFKTMTCFINSIARRVWI